MVLENYRDGAPRQLQVFDPSTRRLGYMLLLPLIDGVYATMLVSGYVNTVSGMLNVAFTVFAGAGSLSIIYSESKDSREMIKNIGPVLLAGSLLVGVLAPSFETVLYIRYLEVVAGVVVGVIGLQMAGVKLAEKVPLSAMMILGLLGSLRPNPELIISLDHVVPSVSTVSVALAGLYLASHFEDSINISVMRKGGAAVLILISASLLGLSIPSETGLVVLGLSLLASLEF